MAVTKNASVRLLIAGSFTSDMRRKGAFHSVRSAIFLFSHEDEYKNGSNESTVSLEHEKTAADETDDAVRFNQQRNDDCMEKRQPLVLVANNVHCRRA